MLFNKGRIMTNKQYENYKQFRSGLYVLRHGYLNDVDLAISQYRDAFQSARITYNYKAMKLFREGLEFLTIVKRKRDAIM